VVVLTEDQKFAWAVHCFMQGDDDMLGVILRMLDIRDLAGEDCIEADYIQPDMVS
jgi:hypothetical protein